MAEATLVRVEDMIPAGRRNRPGLRLEGPRWITVHDTANRRPGADALAHARYLKSDDAAAVPVSWHFTVDDRRIVQHLPLDEVGWHAADGRDGPGNRTSLGIEICEHADGDRGKAEANAAALVAELLARFGLGVEAVVQHHRWTGKDCPRVLRGRPGGWEGFLEAVRSHLGTPIRGRAQATLAQAQAWARARGGEPGFVALAPRYWQYGAFTGIRPEVAYAQAAKETGFGRFGGAVRPAMHNYAGIKRADAQGDRPEDFETFPTPDEGVRAHVNHLAAYCGAPPVGTPHPRYFVVARLPWAGTVQTVEALGGRWAPHPDYGRSIVRDYLAPLLATPAPADGDAPAGTAATEALRAEVARLEAALAAAQREAEALRARIARARAALEG